MTHNTREDEDIIDDLLEKHVHPEPDGENIKYVFTPLRHEIHEDIINLLHQELQKAREEERGRCIKIVEDYGKSMSKLHSEMIGTAHEDSKMMLAFDMHSRLIAVKHITEKMHHSELDQDKV